MDRINIRDLRDGKFLWIDKAALELVSKKTHSVGIAVYAWLCYYANVKDQNCFPSIATLARYCWKSRRTVMRVLKQLENIRVIAIERENGKRSMYKLLEVDGKSKTSISGVTGDKRDTGAVTPEIPVPVTSGTHEQDLIYQELFNNNTAVFSEEKIKELKALCAELLPDINLYQFMQVFKNDRGYPPPIDVMIKLCQRFKKDRNKIKNIWGWFNRSVEAESAQFSAQQNIKEHERLKKEPATIGKILAQMTAH